MVDCEYLKPQKVNLWIKGGYYCIVLRYGHDVNRVWNYMSNWYFFYSTCFVTMKPFSPDTLVLLFQNMGLCTSPQTIEQTTQESTGTFGKHNRIPLYTLRVKSYHFSAQKPWLTP